MGGGGGCMGGRGSGFHAVQQQYYGKKFCSPVCRKTEDL